MSRVVCVVRKRRCENSYLPKFCDSNPTTSKDALAPLKGAGGPPFREGGNLRQRADLRHLLRETSRLRHFSRNTYGRLGFPWRIA